ncbi:MAG: transglutaminase-like domain-containing protein [Acidobacteriota bacterium]|nr:transglutaminase-like domain-containing protein [Acidobacteriota bacterium]
MLFYGTVQELIDLLSGRKDDLELDRAALQLATIEFPGLEPDPYLRILDDYSSAIADRAGNLDDGREFVRAANSFLFGEIGLQGNAADYYNPHNSCLNQVLGDRVGIPITLSIVYIEVARRLAKPVRGIALPGHFVVKYEDDEYSAFIDPFHGGALLTEADCYDLAQLTTPDPRVFAPAGKGQILTRMINNLRGIYFSRQAYGKAVQILDLLIGAHPESADEYKQRGMVHLHNREMLAAKTDLQKYLDLAPGASDRDEIEEQVVSIARWLAMMN